MHITPTKVLVISEHEVIRVGLETLMAESAGIEVVDGSRPDVARHDAHVALYDVIGLHEGDGKDLDWLVRESDLAVLAVSRDLRPDLADRALERGVDGCVSSAVGAEELVAAVEAAAWGDLRGGGPDDAPDLTVNPAALGQEVGLTGREVEMIARITRGQRNDDIARELYLSINSVKTYIRSAYRRIGVSSRSQAVGWGIRHGFEPAPELDGPEVTDQIA